MKLLLRLSQSEEPTLDKSRSEAECINIVKSNSDEDNEAGILLPAPPVWLREQLQLAITQSVKAPPKGNTKKLKFETRQKKRDRNFRKWISWNAP